MTGDSNNKIVLFDIYCEKCKYCNLKEYEDPCNECLETGMREGTHVPEFWVSKVQ